MYLLTSIPTELKWGYVLMMIRVMNNNTHRRIPLYINEQSSQIERTMVEFKVPKYFSITLVLF